jgi:hypothetical protein
MAVYRRALLLGAALLRLARGGLAVRLTRKGLGGQDGERACDGAGERGGVAAQVRLGIERARGASEEADIYFKILK